MRARAPSDSSDIFVAAADHAPVLIWVAGPDQGCTFLNRGWLEFTGRPLADELGAGWTEGVHPDDREHCVLAYERAFASRHPFDVEFRLRRADGVYRWLLNRGVPRYTPDGGFIGYVGSCLDITEERDAREELRLRGQQQGAVAELGRRALERAEVDELLAMAVETVVRDLDVSFAAVLERVPGAPGLIMRANYGGPPELVGTVRRDTGPGTPLGTTLTTREPVVIDDWATEGRFRRSRLVDEHHVASSASVVVRRVGSELFGVLAAYSVAPHGFERDDVLFLRSIANVLGAAIGRRELEDELLNREAEARLALDVGRMGAWRWNPATGAVSWSPELESLYGIEPGSFAGTVEAFVEHVHPDDRERTSATVAHAAEAGSEIDFEHRIVRSDGSTGWMHGRGRPIQGPDGAITQWLGVGIDITERRVAEAERERLLAREREARGDAEEVNRRLSETVARLDALLEHSPLGFGFVDTDLRVVRVNQPLAAISGRRPEESVGAAAAEILPEASPELEPSLRRVLESGEPVVDRELSGRMRSRPGTERHWLASCYPLRGDRDELLGVGLVLVDITERRRAERVVRLVAGVSELVAAAPDLESVLDRAARVPLGDFADSCHVYLRTDAGEPRRVGLAHVDPDVEATLVDGERRHPLDVETQPALNEIMQTGRPLLLADIPAEVQERYANSADELALIRAHGVVSAVAVPLVVRGVNIGLMLFNYTVVSGRHYHRDDVPLAAELGRRVALAIENARLAADAERTRSRLTLLARAGELLTVELDARARIDALARLVLPTFADVCAVYLAEGDEARMAAFAHTDRDRERRVHELTPWPLVRCDGPTPVATAMREGRAVLVATVADDLVDLLGLEGEHLEVAKAMRVRSLLVVPLPGPAGPLGAVGFGFATSGRRFTDSDIAIAQELARRSGPAVENALRYEQEQATAAALQRSLLPEHLPDVPELDVAARYLPGTEGLQIGGDWYDLIPRPDGRVVLVIGDVVGHGVRAASAMGRVRHVLQFCALEEHEPAQIVARLNRHFCAFSDSQMATLLVLALDASGRARYCSAGHPPALVRHADGSVERLEGGRGMPLCASDSARYRDAEARVELGATLLLYTDGLVERRGESLDVGLERLEAEFIAHDDLDTLVDDVLDRLLADRSRADDVAVLAVRPRGSATTLDLSFGADAHELSRLRRVLRDWLREQGVPRETAEELTLATNEAAANAVEHAYGLVDAPFSLYASHRAGVVSIVVRDSGRWRPPRSHEHRGRGLELARALTDRLEVTSDERGTTVRLERTAPLLDNGG